MAGIKLNPDSKFDFSYPGRTIPNPEPPPPPINFEELEIYQDISSVTSRYERDFFRERWFGSDQGLIHFAWEAVKTLDEHDVDSPIKCLPREAYLLDHFNNFLREPIYVVLKSRQIMITWATFIALTWEILRRPYQKIGLVPKKSDDGKDHIEDRIHNFVWGTLPQWLRDDFPEPDLSRGKFQLDWHPTPAPWVKQTGAQAWTPDQKWFSWLASFEKGPHQLRQYTLTDIFWDEMAFQEHAFKAWQAAIPTMGLGRRSKKASGRVQCVSTMLPGSFHDLLCGSPSTVDMGVEIAFGNVLPPPSGFYKNPQPGVVHYRNPKYGAFVAIYSFLADSEKRSPDWEAQESLPLGGPTSPMWLLDYKMQRGAFAGLLVYPHWNRAFNIVPCREVNREAEIFLSFDFGHTVPTAVLFWEWDEQTGQMTCFDEIYLTTTAVGVMKHLIQLKLATHLRVPFEEILFADILGHNVGDPASPGTMLEYGQEPNPLFIVGNPTPDSGQKPWKINDRFTGEQRLDTAFRPSFVCCGIRQYAEDGKDIGTCQAIVIDESNQKRTCGKQHSARATVVFMEGRAPFTESEIPKQQRKDVNDIGLEAPERNKSGIPDHGTDSTRLAVMRYSNFFGIEVAEHREPRWLRVPVEKLSTKEQFWREKHELGLRSSENREAFEEAGEIMYPDADDDDAYA